MKIRYKLILMLLTASTANAETIYIAGDSAQSKEVNTSIVSMFEQNTSATVIDVAIPGTTTIDLKKQIVGFLANGGRFPEDSTAIISIVGNDFLRGMTHFETYARLRDILILLEREHVRVVLNGIPAVSSVSDIRNKPLKLSGLYSLLQAEFPKMKIVDSFSYIYSIPGMISNDNVHLTSEGYFVYNTMMLGAYLQMRKEGL
jgi:hypothetical protein